MRFFKFVTDLHLFAPNEIETSLTDAPNHDVIWLGDIFDVRNCRKSVVPDVIKMIRGYSKLMGWRYLLDNHDAIDGKVSPPILIPGTDIVILGGSEIFWDEDRLHDYTNKEFGAGFLKRQIWVRMLMLVSGLASSKISDTAMARAVTIAKKLGGTRVVCGHKHPNKRLTRTLNGVTLYVLPRGATEILL